MSSAPYGSVRAPARRESGGPVRCLRMCPHGTLRFAAGLEGNGGSRLVRAYREVLAGVDGQKHAASPAPCGLLRALARREPAGAVGCRTRRPPAGSSCPAQAVRVSNPLPVARVCVAAHGPPGLTSSRGQTFPAWREPVVGRRARTVRN